MSEIKPFSGVDDRTPLSSVVPLDTPFTLNIFPSEICNFRCNYCAQSLGKDEIAKQYGLNGKMLDIETAELIAEQSKAFKHKYKLISMMGHGDHLCNKNLPKIISILKKADIAERIDIITNASLLTNEVSDSLIEAGLDILRVSLQGITDASYKKLTGVNVDFNKFYNQLSYFYKKSNGKCKVYVKTMDVSLDSKDEEKKFFELFEKCSDRMYIDKVKPVYDKVTYSDEQMDISTDRYGNRHSPRVVCPQPFYMLSVWSNGDVSPCDALYKASPLGNVHQTALTDMWLNKTHKDFCLAQLNGERFNHSCCSRCCAPDDVAHKEDILDDARNELKKLF
ncbi:MAG: radical SAM protein [Clostridiales bacterium]|nr:radical SAM protein [Clostridiales bacterium]